MARTAGCRWGFEPEPSANATYRHGLVYVCFDILKVNGVSDGLVNLFNDIVCGVLDVDADLCELSLQEKNRKETQGGD